MARFENVRIEYVDLRDLKRWPRNPKDHDLGELSRSVRRFGFVNPLLFDETTGRIVAGHGRLDTLEQRKARGEKPPDGIRVEGEVWLVPVVRGIAFDSEKEAEAYLLADNRQVELGAWNDDLLAQVLRDHKDNFDGTGFDGDDLDRLLAGGGDPERPELPFTAELLEQSNYIVFVFSNEFDWNVIAERFKLGPVRALDSDGKSYERRGTGRVVNGKRLLEALS